MIDQEQLQANSSWGFGFGFHQGEQEIVAGLSGNLAGFDLWCNGIGGVESRQIDVSVKLGTATSGTVVFQDRLLFNATSVGSFFYVDTSAANIPLIPGTRFTLGVFPLGSWDLGGNTGNPYPAGGFFFDSAGGSNFDMAFRTFVSVVPEPTTALLAAIGFAIYGWRYARRRSLPFLRHARSTIAALLILTAAGTSNAVTIDWSTIV